MYLSNALIWPGNAIDKTHSTGSIKIVFTCSILVHWETLVLQPFWNITNLCTPNLSHSNIVLLWFLYNVNFYIQIPPQHDSKVACRLLKSIQCELAMQCYSILKGSDTNLKNWWEFIYAIVACRFYLPNKDEIISGSDSISTVKICTPWHIHRYMYKQGHMHL